MKRPKAWNADEFGLSPDDRRMFAWELDKYFREQRWKALKALWGPPEVDECSTKHRTDGVIDYHRNREEEWTIWRAVIATVAIVIGRHGEDYLTSRTLCFWDSRSTYGGYTVDVLTLSAGGRISIFNDGETFI